MIGLDRRGVLRLAGGLGGFLPSLLSARSARALTPIRRLIIVATPQQMMPHAFVMRAGRPAGAAFRDDLAALPDAQWSRTLAPLAPWKKRLSVIEGLSLLTGIPNDREINSHDASFMNLLTAAGVDKDSSKRVLGPSVDQVIAQAVARPGQIRSLELGSRIYLGGLSNLGADQRTPLIESPRAAVLRLFPEAAPGAGAVVPALRDRIAARRPGVTDFVRREYEQVLPRLGAEDRAKLELHQQLLRDLELRLSLLSRPVDCRAPTESFPDVVGNNRERFELYARLVAAGLACDRTRVVTLHARELINQDFGAPPGDVHQDFAHNAAVDENAAEQMARFNLVYANYVATLLEHLAQISDLGGSLLDNCLVVWVNEHGLTREPHSVTELPVVLAGGGAGSVPMGRYISVARNTPHPFKGAPIGTPHSHLLVSLMQAMGLKAETIGMTEHRTAGGQVVPLTGKLADLG